jgi:hypothetical protein
MEPFIPHFRLPRMNPDQLVTYIKPTNLFPIEQYLTAMEFHVSPDDVNTSGVWFKPRGAVTSKTRYVIFKIYSY